MVIPFFSELIGKKLLSTLLLFSFYPLRQFSAKQKIFPKGNTGA
jgi:hypothetical protein